MTAAPVLLEEWVEIDDSVRRAVMEVMEARRDTGFDEESVLGAELDLGARLGYPHLILTSSATAGAHAVFLRCARAGLTGAAVPVHVYPAIAGAAVSAGLEVEFVSVDSDLISTLSAKDAGKYVEVIHLPWGDVTGPLRLLRGGFHGVVVLDVSHATPRIPGSIWHGGNVRGLYGVGSLGPGKFLSGMELGFVATRDEQGLRDIAALGATRRHRHFEVDPPVATKLRPHPLAVAILQAQLARLTDKLEAHDTTWSYLVPRLNEIEGVRVVTTSRPHERIFWRCLLEVSWPDGGVGEVEDLVRVLRENGVHASRPEYLDDAVTLLAKESPGERKPSSLAPIPARYLCLPGYVLLSRSKCDRLLQAVATATRTVFSDRRYARSGGRV